MITFAEHQRAYFESLDWNLNDRSLSLLTGAPVHDIATWRVALQKQGAADSAATLAVNGTYSRRSPRNVKFDWATVDWSKTNVEIASALGTGPGYVSNMRHRLGHQGVTKHSELFKNGVDWKKNDQELSAELGMEPNVIRTWRMKLGQPAVRRFKPRWTRVSSEDIAKADWARFTDVELSIMWGIGRERVRQIRQKNNLPVCMFQHTRGENTTLLRWIDDHRDELSGKTLKQAAALIPSNSDVSVKRRWLGKCGIKPVPSMERDDPQYGPEWLPNVDWNLPNCVLAYPWKRKVHFFSVHRYRLLKPKAAWFAGGGFSTFFLNKDFLEAVTAQFEVAHQCGVIPDEEGFQKWLKYREELNERVTAK